ncbi:hypothetical protein CEXT_432521 [Caerostris extrusa]|uniref:Uncharacterized protein n=1 Tax=Caerostris extrusa TaxID=172846 RepID=A0AAV4TMS3_CAEEX|nr:hypothetical protein CEXT_432521 [Caerostris extrusa]
MLDISESTDLSCPCYYSMEQFSDLFSFSFCVVMNLSSPGLETLPQPVCDSCNLRKPCFPIQVPFGKLEIESLWTGRNFVRH